MNLPSHWWGGRPARPENTGPFRTLLQMQREMDRMFDDFFRGSTMPAFPAAAGFESEESESHYLLSFDMPGLSKDDLKLEVQEGGLHIFGERKVSGKAEKTYGAYDRWISLPANTDAEGIEAHLEHGVLQIAIPKAARSTGRQIPIGDGQGRFFGGQKAPQSVGEGGAKPRAA